MIRLVLAGRSGSLTTESDSMSSRPACRASPVGVDEKSSLNWMFSRLSLSRFMSYLPLLSFGPSATVPGSTYLLTPPFCSECLSRLPCTVAGSMLRILDGYGFHGKWPACPTLAPCTRCLSIDSHVCCTLPSDLDSRRQPLRCR